MEKKIRILLVEDDKNLGYILKSYLVVKGYPTVLSWDGVEALNRFENEAFDFVILDTVLPSLDGYTLAQRIKQYDKEVPIVFVSSKGSRADVSRGFEVGADDFITKPFSIDELFERVSAICKRTVLKTKSKHVYQLASYTFDGVRHVLTRNGVEKKLTNRELDLLFLFCEYKNRIVERSMALQRIWHEENYFNARNMDVYVAKIRRLFKDDPNIELQNIHGVGYRLFVKE